MERPRGFMGLEYKSFFPERDSVIDLKIEGLVQFRSRCSRYRSSLAPSWRASR